MNDRAVRSFIDVVESKSFNKAEQHLFITRQALKKQIDALENELGFRLLSRSAHGIALTEAGQYYYDRMKDFLRDYDETVHHCREIALYKGGKAIRIGHPGHPAPIIGPLCLSFSKQYPEIHQELIKVDPRHTLESVQDETVDVVEYVLPPDMEVSASTLDSMKLIDMPYYCIVNKGDPLSEKTELRMEDLQGRTIGLRRNTNHLLIQQLRDTCQDIILIEVEGNEIDRIYSVCYNHGVFISRSNYSSFLQNQVRIPLVGAPIPVCYLIYRKDHSKAVDLFLEMSSAIYPQYA